MSDTNVHRVVGNLLVGTSHFFVDTTTNQVGINTSSPSAALDVATGDVKVGSGITLGNNGTITATGGFNGDGSGLSGVNSDSGSWVNGSSSNIHLAVSTDNVGIGVLDASYKLDVDGDINISTGSTLRVGGTPAVFSNWSVDGSDIYRSTGNVGIGVVSPGAELHVGGTGAIIVPAGTTGDRPGTVVNGMFRYNSEIGYMEAYTVSGWGVLAPPPSIVSVSPLTTLPSGGQVAGYASSTPTEMPQPLNAVDGDNLGWSVAVSGNGMYALAGSPYDDGGGSDSGALHIYVRNASTNAWTHQQELAIPSITGGDYWGYTQYALSLSNDGTYAVAGAQYHNSSKGRARVWVRNGTSWTHQQELTISSMPAGAYFGSGVDISEDGNYIIIGAYSDDVLRSGAGAAHIFIRSNTTWTHQATLPRTGDGASGDQFGVSVGISSDGTYAIVGSPYGTPNTGSAHIYIRSVTTWTHQKLMVDPNGQSGDAFGHGVHISGDGNYAAIGAHNDNTNTGAGFVFVRNGTSWTLQPPQLTITSAATGDFAFEQLKLSQDGTVLVVSVRGRKYSGTVYGSFVIFNRVGTTWSQTKEILSHDLPNPVSYDVLGYCVDISSDGKTIIAGAYGRDTGGTDRGAMFSLLAAEEIIDASTQVFTVTGTSFDSGLAINLVGADGTNYEVVDRTFVNAATATFKIGDLSSAAAQVANRPYNVKITGGSGLAATSTQTIGFSGISWTSPAAGATLTYYIGSNSTQNLVATDDIGGNDVTFSIVSGGMSGLDLNSQTSSPATYGGTASGSGSSATVTIRVTDNVSGSTLDRTFSIVTVIVGEAVYTTPGTFAWTTPTGVTSVCVVCVGGGGAGQNSPSAAAGGGGLGWKNNISVSPGSSYTVVVGRRGERVGSDNSTLMDGGDSYFIGTGIVKGGKGRFANTSSATAYGGGGDYTGDGGGRGGDGAWGTGGREPGGGGAGGYTGNGGRGGNRHEPTGSAARAGSGGGGGGGGMADLAASGGGAVGLYGEGANGTAGGDSTIQGYATVAGGGSGGENSYYTTRGGTTKSTTGTNAGDSHGGSPGGGGFGRFGNDPNSFGGYGAVRIMWGLGRSFPNNAA